MVTRFLASLTAVLTMSAVAGLGACGSTGGGGVTCAPDCPVCQTQDCSLICQETNDEEPCSLICTEGADCDLACGLKECDLLCVSQSRCAADCEDRGGCTAACHDGSSCGLDCAGSSGCSLACSGGSTCDLTCQTDCFVCCKGSEACALACRDGEVTECPGAEAGEVIKVCGRECPDPSECAYAAEAPLTE